jgi:hypothetical protein
MSRYIKELPTNKSPEQIQVIANQFFDQEGFKQVTYKGEQAWKKGMGILTGPQYISVKVSPEIVKVEAWIKFALLPGVYLGELGLDGFVGAIPKSLLKGKVSRLEKMLAN